MTPRQHWENLIQLQQDISKPHLIGKHVWFNRQPSYLFELYREISSALDIEGKSPRLVRLLDIPLTHWKTIVKENLVQRIIFLLQIILVVLGLLVILLLLEKNEKWRNFQIQKALAGEDEIVPPGYEIVQEVYEVVIPKEEKQKQS